jgi:small subunit ribosomal protein S17
MNNRRRMTGVVKSDKMTKTVVVEVNRTYKHPLYKKVVHASSRFKAHDEMGAKIGDVVIIVESRPLSRDKRWVVETIIRPGEAGAGEPIATDEAAIEALATEAVATEAVEAEAAAAEMAGTEEAEETGEGE